MEPWVPGGWCGTLRVLGVNPPQIQWCSSGARAGRAGLLQTPRWLTQPRRPAWGTQRASSARLPGGWVLEETHFQQSEGSLRRAGVEGSCYLLFLPRAWQAQLLLPLHRPPPARPTPRSGSQKLLPPHGQPADPGAPGVRAGGCAVGDPERPSSSGSFRVTYIQRSAARVPRDVNVEKEETVSAWAKRI